MGSTFRLRELSLPNFARIAALVKGEKLTTALPHVYARVLQTATAILFLAMYVVFEEGSLGVLA